MAGTPKKRERQERLQALVQDEEAFDWLCARIASGETLLAFCRELDVPYVAVNQWIQQDDDRRVQYKQALEMRDAHNRDVVVTELLRILTVDITQAFYPDGSIKPISEIPEDVRRCIAGFELAEIWGGVGEDRMQIGVLKKLKLWDKNKALELMAKHLKMLTEKHEHSGPGGGPIQTNKTLRIEFVTAKAPAAPPAEIVDVESAEVVPTVVPRQLKGETVKS